MKQAWLAVAALLLAALTAPLAGQATAGAAPSFGGYTGLVLTPTADALDKSEFNTALFARELEIGSDETLYAGNLGLARGLEVGFARIKFEHGPHETFLNAKYRFKDETEANPGLAVGIIDLASEVDATPYFVLSKSLLPTAYVPGEEILSPRVHIGVGGGQLDGLFGGIASALGESLLLMVEYDSRNINVGARLAVGDYLWIHASAMDGFGDLGFGVSFNKSL